MMGNKQSWDKIDCDECGSALYDPGPFVQNRKIHDYFTHYRCKSCVGWAVCKICKKQVDVSTNSKFIFPLESHIMSHYGIDGVEVQRPVSDVFMEYFDNLVEIIPYVPLINGDDYYETMVERMHRDWDEEFTKILPMPNNSCSICLDSYDTFPSIEVVVNHLKQKHGLIDSPTVNVFNYVKCGCMRKCNIRSNVTVCDGRNHITKIDSLPDFFAIVS